MKLLGKYWQLARADQILVARTLLLVVLIRVAISVFGLRISRRLLAVKAPRRERDASRAAEWIRRVSWSVHGVGRRVPGANCLVQALAADRLLKAQGCDCCIQFGVARRDGGGIDAHSWVEHGGCVVVGGTSDPHKFAPLAP
jgi:hypothetical protein